MNEMFDLGSIGRIMLVIGGLIFFIGLILTLGGKVPFLGRLPGDVRIQQEGFSCYFPIVTSIVLSILLSLLLNIILRLLNK